LDSAKIPGISSESTLRGYEIHMGRSSGDIFLFKLRRLSDNAEPVIDGSLKGNVWGTYIHGIFDNDRFRRSLLNSIRTRNGLSPVEKILDYSRLKDDALTKWSEILESAIDMKFIEDLVLRNS